MEKLRLSGVNPVQAAKELSRVVEIATCIECCKIYILPETAACGHTLCHGCWIGRPTCPVCASSITRRSLKSNTVVKKYSDCAEALVASFEKLFNIKLEEYTEDLPAKAPIVQKDPNLNVKAWLADSQNQFSALMSSQLSTQASINAVEVKTCDIQIHTNSKKPSSPQKKILAPPPPQDDWDKIETVADSEDFTKNKENVGPMENELFSFEDEEYTTDHPRRSSRKRELKNDSKPSEHSVDKHTSSNVSIDTDKLSKGKQNWSNVKRMRKEFSKLHKKNKNKLNVSIEMCKKTQSAISKPTTANADHAMSQPLTSVTIDDCTPVVHQTEDKKESAATSEVVAIDYECINDNVNDKQPLNNSLKSNEKLQVANEKKSLNDVTNENVTKSVDSNKETTHHVNIPFLKKGALQTHKTAVETADVIQNNTVQTVNHVVNNNLQTPDSDDIQITIKIGNTLTNIFIKKKNNDVKVNLNTDQEVQTAQTIDKSVSCNTAPSTKDCNVQNIEINIGSEAVVSAITQQTNCDEPCSQNKNNCDKTVSIKKNTESAETVTLQSALNKTNNLTKSLSTKKNTESAQSTPSGPNNMKLNLNKTVSTKKHTASADTVPFEITDSVEKELSKIMECDDEKNNEVQNKSVKNTQIIHDADVLPATANSEKQADEEIMDLDEDIFASGSVKSSKVQMLKECHAPSEILMPSLKPNKKLTQTLRSASKRDRETNDEIPCNKKLKVTAEIEDEFTEEPRKQDAEVENQSCSMNYDLVMGEVFASIDADMENVDKSQSIIKNQSISKPDAKNDVDSTQHSQNLKTQKTQKKVLGPSKLANATQNRLNNLQHKESENLFTLSNKESQVYLQQKHGPETQAHIENILTPGMCRDLAASGQEQDDAIQATPCNERDDSDMSMYEDTPHKSLPVKSSDKPGLAVNSSQHHEKTVINPTKQTQNSQAMRSVINISDTENSKTEKDITIVETKPKQTLDMETPSTMNKFCDQVKHNSTPVARKSLNFVSDKQNISTSILTLAKNTQEQEILAKAFESSQKFVKPPPQIKYCIAASCLTSAEVKVVETLCVKKGWLFVREYTNDLTHLVVGVDKDGRSQRTVKFMCAVAAGKWIVRYEWAELCAARGHRPPPEEGPFEALDWTGDPGPQRARLADKKLFEGITFFCKPPFTVLNESVLKTMLEAAGGVVVSEARQVRVVGDSVRLLLAEPEHTQENQYTYLALELSIVPVNYEWALNCLGSYTLTSVAELLLCPYSLLPAAALRWPPHIIAQDAEYDDDS